MILAILEYKSQMSNLIMIKALKASICSVIFELFVRVLACAHTHWGEALVGITDHDRYCVHAGR